MRPAPPSSSRRRSAAGGAGSELSASHRPSSRPRGPGAPMPTWIAARAQGPKGPSPRPKAQGAQTSTVSRSAHPHYHLEDGIMFVGPSVRHPAGSAGLAASDSYAVESDEESESGARNWCPAEVRGHRNTD